MDQEEWMHRYVAYLKPPWLATLRTGTDGLQRLGKLGRKTPKLPRSKMPVHSSPSTTPR